MTCDVVEVSGITDEMSPLKLLKQIEGYYQLMWNLELLHPTYRFPFVSIIIDALGCVTINLHNSLEMYKSFFNEERPRLTCILEI